MTAIVDDLTGGLGSRGSSRFYDMRFG